MRLLKILNFCSLEDAAKKMKGKHRLGKITLKYVPDKLFVSRIYKEFLQLNNKKDNPTKKNGQNI